MKTRRRSRGNWHDCTKVIRTTLKVCQYCESLFLSKAEKDDHEANHRGGRGIKCLSCRQSFVTTRGLTNHLKSHHKTKMQRQPESTPKVYTPNKVETRGRSRKKVSEEAKSENPGALEKSRVTPCSVLLEKINLPSEVPSRSRTRSRSPIAVKAPPPGSHRLTIPRATRRTPQASPKTPPAPPKSAQSSLKTSKAPSVPRRTPSRAPKLEAVEPTMKFKTESLHLFEENEQIRCPECPDRTFASVKSLLQHCARLHSSNDSKPHKCPSIHCEKAYINAYQLNMHIKKCCPSDATKLPTPTPPSTRDNHNYNVKVEEKYMKSSNFAGNSKMTTPLTSRRPSRCRSIANGQIKVEINYPYVPDRQEATSRAKVISPSSLEKLHVLTPRNSKTAALPQSSKASPNQIIRVDTKPAMHSSSNNIDPIKTRPVNPTPRKSLSMIENQSPKSSLRSQFISAASKAIYDVKPGQITSLPLKKEKLQTERDKEEKPKIQSLTAFDLKKRFVCLFCNHRFSQNAHLEQHMPTHTLEKPFLCHICDLSYSRQSALWLHRQKKHGGKIVKPTVVKKKKRVNNSIQRNLSERPALSVTIPHVLQAPPVATDWHLAAKLELLHPQLADKERWTNGNEAVGETDKLPFQFDALNTFESGFKAIDPNNMFHLKDTELNYVIGGVALSGEESEGENEPDIYRDILPVIPVPQESYDLTASFVFQLNAPVAGPSKADLNFLEESSVRNLTMMANLI